MNTDSIYIATGTARDIARPISWGLEHGYKPCGGLFYTGETVGQGTPFEARQLGLLMIRHHVPLAKRISDLATLAPWKGFVKEHFLSFVLCMSQVALGAACAALFFKSKPVSGVLAASSLVLVALAVWLQKKD